MNSIENVRVTTVKTNRRKLFGKIIKLINIYKPLPGLMVHTHCHGTGTGTVLNQDGHNRKQWFSIPSVPV